MCEQRNSPEQVAECDNEGVPGKECRPNPAPVVPLGSHDTEGEGRYTAANESDNECDQYTLPE